MPPRPWRSRATSAARSRRSGRRTAWPVVADATLDRAHGVDGRGRPRRGRDGGGRRRRAGARGRRRRRHRPRLTVPGRRSVDVADVVLSVVEHRVRLPARPGRRAAARHRADGAVVGRRGRRRWRRSRTGAGRRPARSRGSGWPGAYSIAADGRTTSPPAARRVRAGEARSTWSATRWAGSWRCGWPRRTRDRVRRLVLEDVGMPHPRRPSPPARPEGELDVRLAGRGAGAARDRRPGPGVAGGRARRWRRRPSSWPAGRAASSPAEHVAELVAALPDGRSVTLDTGHEVHETDPGGFTGEVAAFLDALDDPTIERRRSVGAVRPRASGCGRPAPARCARRCRSPRRRAG